MREQVWLSYVIPLYNCGKYISRCIDSLLNQGLNDDEYEIIVVNDGSTDDGALIVERYCRRYPNIRLINKRNEGVGAARNRGVEEAVGTYIHFVDADDRILSDGMRVLKESYLSSGKNPDMITFYAHTVDRYYKNELESIGPHKIVFCGSFLEYGNKFGFGWSSPKRIIKRKFLNDNNLRFKSYVISEDVMFCIELFMITTGTIIATDLNIYRYCIRQDSALNRSDNIFLERAIAGYMDLFTKVKVIESSSPYRRAIFENEIAQFQRGAFMRLLSGSFSIRCIRRMLSEGVSHGFFPIRHEQCRIHKFINIMINSPVLIYLMSKVYRFVFLPYIKPYIRRN